MHQLSGQWHHLSHPPLWKVPLFTLETVRPAKGTRCVVLFITNVAGTNESL